MNNRKAASTGSARRTVALAFLMYSIAAVAQADTVTTIDYPGASVTEVNSINERGEIVGSAVVAGVRRGFRYLDGVFDDIIYPGAIRTEGLDVNAQGEIAGFYQDASGQFYGYTLDSRGTFTSYDYEPATTGTFILGLNASGTFAGEFKLGQAFGVTGYAVVRTSDGEWLQLIPPGSTNARANSVNSRGDVVGLMTGGGMRGWLLDKHGEYTIFAVENATVTNPQEISDSGTVVGVYILGGVQHGFIRSADGQIEELIVQPGSTSTRALGINARGDIVGTYDLGGMRHGFILER
jgi:uncharacterized membrane protein